MPLRRFHVLTLLVSAVLAISQSAWGQESPLHIGGNTIAWGGSCQPGFPNIIAGSRYFVTIINVLDLSPPPLVPGWPQGYVMEAALDLPEGRPFVATTGLIEQLNPVRYLSDLNLTKESDILQGRHSANSSMTGLNGKEFFLDIPAGLAGHTLTLQARYSRDSVNLQSNTPRPITIIAPCSRSDTARILATFIYAAFRVGEYARVLEIADSMLANNLSDAAAWTYANGSAKAIQRYDKALIYLDQLYNDFGRMGPGDKLNPPQLNREGPRSRDMQESYAKTRQGLLRLQAQHEQQQQHK
jgi:hypothetical protein